MKILRKKIHDVYPGLEVTDFSKLKSGSDIYAYEGPCTCGCSPSQCSPCTCYCQSDVDRYGVQYDTPAQIQASVYAYNYDATLHGYG